MGQAPLVSVIMPCYGMGRYIQEALESVAAQSYSHWEILAVDDCGPADGTDRIVAAFASKHSKHRVEWIRHEVNQGVSASRNTAIQAARGEYLAFLDPDDYWKPEHLRYAVEALTGGVEDPDSYSAVTSPVETFREEQPERVSLCRFTPTMIWAFPASLAMGNSIQPSAVVVRREDVLAVGLFDTDPRIQHVEDLDLWIRLAEHGCRFKFLETSTCRYRKHASGATADLKRMDERLRRLTDKHAKFLVHQYMVLFRVIVPPVDYSAVLNGPIYRMISACDRVLRYMKRTVFGWLGK